MPPIDTIELAQSLSAAASASRQRRVLVLGGEAGWARAEAARLPLPDAAQGLWIGPDAPPGWVACAPREARGQLGREYARVCLDVFAGFDADAFGAVAGTLVGGGLLCLLSPPLAAWGDCPDPARARARGSPAAGDRFLARLAGMLADAPGVCVLGQDGRLAGDAQARRPIATPVAAPWIAVDGCVNPEQRAAVAAVLRAATGHRRRPTVLTAHRGRGKSAAFGLAAAVLMAEHGRRVVVTGPSLAAVEAVFAHAARRLPAARRTRTALTLGEASLSFVAPDALAEAPPQTDLVLVDEAACLPQALVLRLLRRCPRLAFATTVHGYEGSGRAFALRFSARLDAETPGWRALSLHEPVRWAAGDPLEALSFRALLLDAEPAVVDGAASHPLARATIERLGRDALAADEALLREVFGLLIIAHYRTRPQDLRQLLDGPSLAVWVARLDGRVVAVALVAEEGGLPADLAAGVAQGRRRVHGHLLPQVLAAHCGRADAMALRGWRVVRLAVHPTLQRRGLGAALIARLANEAAIQGLDWLGASFGATPPLLTFWRRAGLLPLRVGATREAVSGAHAALVLRPVSTQAGRLHADLRRRYLESLPQLLGDSLRGVEPRLALELLARGPSEAPAPALDPAWRREAADFVAGAREYEDALGALWRLAVDALPQAAAAGRAHEALAMKVLQKRGWEHVAARAGVPGRRQVIALLREAAARLLD